MTQGYKCWLWTGASSFSKVVPCTIVVEAAGFVLFDQSAKVIIDGRVGKNFAIRQQAECIIINSISKENLYRGKPRVMLDFLNVYGDRVAKDPEGIDCSADGTLSTGAEIAAVGLTSLLAPNGSVAGLPGAVSGIKKQAIRAKVATKVYEKLINLGCVSKGRTSNFRSQLTTFALALVLIVVATVAGIALVMTNINTIAGICLLVALIFAGVYGMVKYIYR
jgi:hypothetical protein